MSVNYVEVIPDPSRVIEGLRDTGYSPETAIEDIIDNSISAGASKIKVNLRMDLSGEVSVSIIDNGCGMNEEELKNAMKYGSRLRPDPASLGKFGLGMKTASTAFARKLVVVSRGESSKDYMKAYWDLDHVVKEKKWELALEEPSNEEI
ncbi:MAG: ATP-binding protein, partial [Candidatus Gracilibacteria bacterium]|nr:ATP-binding protein [Candidatus Gracilibacteria bacterium]